MRRMCFLLLSSSHSLSNQCLVLVWHTSPITNMYVVFPAAHPYFPSISLNILIVSLNLVLSVLFPSLLRPPNKLTSLVHIRKFLSWGIFLVLTPPLAKYAIAIWAVKVQSSYSPQWFFQSTGWWSNNLPKSTESLTQKVLEKRKKGRK